jgi:hypothetical protein
MVKQLSFKASLLCKNNSSSILEAKKTSKHLDLIKNESYIPVEEIAVVDEFLDKLIFVS